MRPDQTAQNYLLDLGQLLTEYSVEAKKRWLAAKGSEGEAFESGYLMGLHRVITLMQQQAESFGLEPSEVGLGQIDERFFLDGRSEL
jgi:hypothetical protein